MGRLAVILGSNALGPGGEEIAAAAAEHGAAIVQRHGADGDSAYLLPHEIDHTANLRALVQQGCDRVLGIGSVGSLSAELPVGSLLFPDDFIALQVGLSSFDDARAHSAPGFDPRWRGEVLEAWRAGGQAPRDGGVYWQTLGPRFETPAEIRLIASHADVVGMTIASECVVAGELGLDYAALCVVDNLANGIGASALDVAGLEDDRLANAARLREGLEAVLPRLGAVGR
jgi:5'-methylthioadenosine phosphorylase